MSRLFRACAFPLLVAATGLLPTGCGGVKGVRVRGHVLWDGHPYRPSADEQMQVSFVSVGGGARISAASSVDPGDGSWELQGPPGGLIPPGNYRILVACILYGPDVPAGQQFKDKFQEAFSEKNSPLGCEITAEPEQVLDIDLGNKTVTRK
jgi:hypothetical protein